MQPVFANEIDNSVEKPKKKNDLLHFQVVPASFKVNLVFCSLLVLQSSRSIKHTMYLSRQLLHSLSRGLMHFCIGLIKTECPYW